MKTYHTEFRFADPIHSHLHMTHKYFGELSSYEISYICQLIGDYLIGGDRGAMADLIFSRVENNMFGGHRVLTHEDQRIYPFPDLKYQLDAFRLDRFEPAIAHVATRDLEFIVCDFDRYVLVEKDHHTGFKTDLFTIYI